MTTTIHEVLGELRAASLDERDKGDKFERLVKAYLEADPEWSAKFSDVWLWSDWAGRDGVTDIGIDLVAANRDRDDFTAIQCKFYAPGHRVAKADIDSFLSASMRPDFGFSQRIVFDTSAGWSGNAEETLKGVAQRVDISYLDDAAIDWSQFRWETPEVVSPTGPKHLRPHQTKALEDVRAGLATYDRGKLIMACGTGKTFTSLKIAEDLVGHGGSVLFLVPSIQLLSQSLREWMANTELDIRPFAVCSDVRVGRRVQTDDADMATIDLTEPATTDPAKLLERMRVGKYAKSRMTVVFSTYQSIDVIIEAQRQGLADFDLVICDEAHRTTGVTLAGQDESTFVRVHDNTALRAAKRLYMTATPRVFGDDVRRKANDADAVLADMSDEDTYGPELHRLGFGDAVEADLLTDYKVLVLAVDEQYVAENFQQAMSQSGEIKLDEAAKLIGCWNGLAKNFGPSSEADDPAPDRPMRTAVAFAQHIRGSQAAAQAFPTMVDRSIIDLPDGRVPLRIEAQHVDGTMGIHERNTHLTWLKADTSDSSVPVCRILTNAKCLSEGVDVPALDAVLFLTPRGSQVDVVQSVGRVMRKAPGKELGYIILPVVVPSGVAPEDALRDNERYKVVWQVLQALRSHDDRFHALVNRLELNKQKPTSKLDIIPVTTPTDADADGSSRDTSTEEEKRQESVQAVLEFPTDQFRDAMYARIVAKVGERRYWETWAKDVADIAAAHVARIKGLLADPESNPAKEFEVFLGGLRGNLNDNITRDEAIDMLAQHLVTRPIFEALFEGYDFATTNPVAKTMELMLASLDKHDLASENETLEKFYASVRRRVEGVDNAEGKQRILVELYDKFFAVAFKRTVDKLGIVYTPVEVVDFILRSADAVLREEFGQGLTDEGVHVLDGFTGTGTFLVRLLQSGLIEPHDLARKYAHELHGNELLLLAYYIACVNIEQTYADLTGHSEPFPGLILTDTFQSWEPDDKPDLNVFPENNARLEALKKLPITVIVGNPPYSSGQDSANDNNANDNYPALDDSIRTTYMPNRDRGGNNSMYDSYIRAIRWASLRIKDQGVIAFITNGGWLTGNTADGMRRSLVSDFSSIYAFNLRGNGRVGGEAGRREGRPLFEFGGWRQDGTEIKNSEGGSRATIAIVVLVKNPHSSGPARVRYAQVDDYLSAGEKVRAVAAADSIDRMLWRELEPNEHGDWLNLRDERYGTFIPLGAKHGDDARSTTVFELYGRGLETGRDAWVYNFDLSKLLANVKRTIEAYNVQVDAFAQHVAANPGKKPKDLVNDFIDLDPTKISWTLSLKSRLVAGRKTEASASRAVVASYRPFTRQYCYFDRTLNHIQGQSPNFYPLEPVSNIGFTVTGAASHYEFAAMMSDRVPDLHLLDTGQFFPRYRYELVEGAEVLDFADAEDRDDVISGYRRIDNITDDALARFVAAYPSEPVTKDDVFFYVYGLLHSPEYRETYAADLKKMLPRIPTVQDFRAFSDAGRALSDLHVGYETVEPFPLDGLAVEPQGDAFEFFSVGAKKMTFGKASAEQKAVGERYDRSIIHYNDRITVSGIPAEAYRYMLGSRSAVEWIIDRYYVKTDKASGIVNDPNDWSRKVGDPRYTLDLLARVVAVSVETMKIVDALPALDIIDGR